LTPSERLAATIAVHSGVSPFLPVEARASERPQEGAMNESWLLWGLLFGSVGLGFFVYGKRQKAVVPLACGLALMIFPYFVSSTFVLVAVGAVLMAVPYFVRL
jgi:hypothetical protein